MIVYMKVTRDEYELPLAIADTAPELARKTGTTKEVIYSSICRQKQGKLKSSQFKRVDIGELEENEIDVEQ